MATTPRISALIEALQQEMEVHGDLPVLGYIADTDTECVEIDLELNLEGEEPVMLLILDAPRPVRVRPDELMADGTSRSHPETPQPAQNGQANP